MLTRTATNPLACRDLPNTPARTKRSLRAVRTNPSCATSPTGGQSGLNRRCQPMSSARGDGRGPELRRRYSTMPGWSTVEV